MSSGGGDRDGDGGGGQSARREMSASRRLPDFLQSVNLKYVKLGYHYLITHLLTLTLIPLMVVIVIEAGRTDPDELRQLWVHLQYNLVSVLALIALLVFGSTLYMMTRPRPVYLVDYACYVPPRELQAPYRAFMEHSALCGFSDAALEFQGKILERSGLGEETYVPAAMHCVPPRPSMANARAEAEQVMFGALDSLFRATGIKPKDVGVLVVNCSLFNPTPSLSAMIVNRYAVREHPELQLGGMGCSAGVSPSTSRATCCRCTAPPTPSSSARRTSRSTGTSATASPCSSPTASSAWGCAVLLSNRAAERGAPSSGWCTCAHPPRRRRHGLPVRVPGAGRAGQGGRLPLQGPHGHRRRRPQDQHHHPRAPRPPRQRAAPLLRHPRRQEALHAKIKPTPDFKLAFDHFCIHAGGRAVIDELEKNLQLRPLHVEASRMTLHRFGNTSSSSIWYELAYIEAKGRIRKGHKIWQIAFGSGFKCNSAVWQALRNVKPSPNNPWDDCIHRYPVPIVDGIPSQ
ncbi:3-ketoacyl-CoA synthase 4 [Ananas comosus]|uniref:3-ketoacyl-CoA synthase n=1 Tax=Ananas comosus TaxID=4615 RepID=A0A199VFS9_ANACO|nr:3-ketoacyl-CoA synthase 4 [Ananas comosus]